MKAVLTLFLCLSLIFSFSGCGRQPDSGSGSVPDFSESQAESSPAESAVSSQSETSSGDAVSQESGTQNETEDPAAKWPRSFISMPVTMPDGSSGETALLILRAPEEWVFNNYTVFSIGDRKAAEIARILPAAGKEEPFSDAMTGPYLDNSFYPEGFGLVSMHDSVLNGHHARIMSMKMWPDDSEEPIYPFYILYQIGDYVVDIHLYTGNEGDTEPDALSYAILNSMELFFDEEESEDASGSSVRTDTSAADSSSGSADSPAMG